MINIPYDYDAFREYRKRYFLTLNGHMTISHKYGWLPQTQHSHKIYSSNGLSVEMRYNSTLDDGHHIPLIYFRICILDKKNQPIIKFMLEPRAFFGLLHLTHYIHRCGISSVCAQCLAYQEKEPWDPRIHRGSIFYKPHRPRRSAIEHHRLEIPGRTAPIMVLSEPVQLQIITANGKRQDFLHLLRVFYTPCQAGGSPKRFPWRIQLQQVSLHSQWQSPQRKPFFRESVKHHISLSEESFFDVTEKMWCCFVSWMDDRVFEKR